MVDNYVAPSYLETYFFAGKLENTLSEITSLFLIRTSVSCGDPASIWVVFGMIF